MKAKLLVVLGKTTKREVSLQLPAVLGRGREANITVAHPLISRRHCEISEYNGLLMLRDLSSLNGTMIAGRRIITAPLLPEAEFTIGPLTFRVSYKFHGDLESVPDIQYGVETEAASVAETGESPDAGDDAAPEAVADDSLDALPAAPSNESLSGELSLADLMALADSEPEEHLLTPPPSLREPHKRPPGLPRKPSPAGRGKPSAPPVPHGQKEPAEVDSSLQSGGHVTESPWTTEFPAATTPPPKPQSVQPPKKPSFSDGNDPEFGSYEGLR